MTDRDLTEREVHEQEMLEATRAAMSTKLRENSAKESWRESSIQWLVARLFEEQHELEAEVDAVIGGTGDWQAVIDEAADVANFAGMVIDAVHERHGIPRPKPEDTRWADRVRLLEFRANKARLVLAGLFDPEGGNDQC